MANERPTLTQEDVLFMENIKKQITDRYSWLINLTKDKRQSIPKMGNRRYPAAQKALQIGQQNSQHIPGSFSMDDFTNNFQNSSIFAQMLLPLKQATEMIDDTRLDGNHKTWKQALKVKDLMENANRDNAGLDDVVDELNEFFKHTDKEEEDTTPTTPVQ